MAETKMVKTMRKALNANPDMEALALVSTDGLPIETLLSSEMEEDRIAAVGAALLSLGERAAMELEKGVLEQVIIRADGGDAVLVSVGEDAVLLALMRKGAKLGMIFLALNRLVGELKKLV